MNLKQFIESLAAQGYTEEQINEALSAHQLTDEKEVTLAAQSLVTATLASNKVHDVLTKLESIQIVGEKQWKHNGKKFDVDLKKVVDVTPEESKSREQLNNLLHAIANKDKASESIIAKEIASEKSLSTHRSDSAAVGGYLVPDPTDNAIMQMLYSQSAFLSATNGRTIESNGRIYPIMFGISVTGIANQDTAVTETNATLSNPTISVNRVGGYTNISNELIRQRVDFIDALTAAYASAVAEYADLIMVAGFVSANSDLFDGILAQTKTNKPTAVAMADFNFSVIEALERTISDNAGSMVLMGNKKIKQKIGNFKFDSGAPMFPEYFSSGSVSPQGIPFIQNTKIPSTFTSGIAKRTTGTSDVLIAMDPSKVLHHFGDIRIDSSEHIRFTYDQTQFRVLARMGVLVPMGASDCGITVAAQEITN